LQAPMPGPVSRGERIRQNLEVTARLHSRGFADLARFVLRLSWRPAK
jgi:hypothetical protein